MSMRHARTCYEYSSSGIKQLRAGKCCSVCSKAADNENFAVLRIPCAAEDEGSRVPISGLHHRVIRSVETAGRRIPDLGGADGVAVPIHAAGDKDPGFGQGAGHVYGSFQRISGHLRGGRRRGCVEAECARSSHGRIAIHLECETAGTGSRQNVLGGKGRCAYGLPGDIFAGLNRKACVLALSDIGLGRNRKKRRGDGNKWIIGSRVICASVLKGCPRYDTEGEVAGAGRQFEDDCSRGVALLHILVVRPFAPKLAIPIEVSARV